MALPDGRLYPYNEDVPFILCYSLIMLNTDAYNPAIREDRRMTLKQFLSNNRGIDQDENSQPRDLPVAFLSHLYTAIKKEEIKALKMAAPAPAPKDASGRAAQEAEEARKNANLAADAILGNPSTFGGDVEAAAAHASSRLEVVLEPKHQWLVCPWRRATGRRVLRCLVRDLWPAVDRVTRFVGNLSDSPMPQHMMRRGDPRNDGIAQKHCLDALKHALTAFLFLGLAKQATEAAGLLARIEELYAPAMSPNPAANALLDSFGAHGVGGAQATEGAGSGGSSQRGRQSPWFRFVVATALQSQAEAQARQSGKLAAAGAAGAGAATGGASGAGPAPPSGPSFGPKG